MPIKTYPSGLVTFPRAAVFGPPPNLLPGFDPNHVVNANNSNPSFERGVSALAVSGQGQAINLLTGAKGTLTGAPTSTMTTVGSGLSTTSTAKIAFPAAFTSSQVTLGAIVFFKAVPAAVQVYCCFTTGASSTDIICASNGTLAWSYNSSATTSLGMPAFIAGHAYLFLTSYSAVTGNSVGRALQLDLNTGKINTATMAPTAAAVGYTNFDLCNSGSGGGPTTANSIVIAAMGNFNFLDTPELLEWGRDPWAFWYPNRSFAFGLQSLSFPPGAPMYMM